MQTVFCEHITVIVCVPLRSLLIQPDRAYPCEVCGRKFHGSDAVKTRYRHQIRVCFLHCIPLVTWYSAVFLMLSVLPINVSSAQQAISLLVGTEGTWRPNTQYVNNYLLAVCNTLIERMGYS